MYIRNSGLISRADKGRLLSYIPSMWGSRHSEVISTFLRISVFFLVMLIFPFLLYLSYCRKFSRRHKIRRRDENRHYGAAKSTAIFCKFLSSLVYPRKKRKMMNCSSTLNSNRMLYDPSLSLRVSKSWPQSNLRCREYTLTVVWLMTAT